MFGVGAVRPGKPHKAGGQRAPQGAQRGLPETLRGRTAAWLTPALFPLPGQRSAGTLSMRCWPPGRRRCPPPRDTSSPRWPCGTAVPPSARASPLPGGLQPGPRCQDPASASQFLYRGGREGARAFRWLWPQCHRLTSRQCWARGGTPVCAGSPRCLLPGGLWGGNAACGHRAGQRGRRAPFLLQVPPGGNFQPWALARGQLDRREGSLARGRALGGPSAGDVLLGPPSTQVS